jgi:hypothetical protein
LTAGRTTVIIHSTKEYISIKNGPYVCGNKLRALTQTASGLAKWAGRILSDGRPCACGFVRFSILRPARCYPKGLRNG